MFFLDSRCPALALPLLRVVNGRRAKVAVEFFFARIAPPVVD